MLYRTHVLSALEERREQFVNFERGLRDGVGELASRLRALAGRAGEEVRRESESEGKRVTYPSNELEVARGAVVPFAERWRSHEEARRWALGALSNRVTFAADGSQLFPGREASVPVAAVQVASFENPHSPEGRYLKDVHFEVITPDELCAGGRGYDSPEQVVGARRFELEADAVCAFLERRRGWRSRGERMPLAFFDNTLVFSSPRGDSETFFSKRYAKALVKLITLSRETEVPVVGYVDHSYAPDVRDLLEAFYKDLPETSAYDAQIFHARAHAGGARLLDAWGDRTIFWYCRRRSLAASFFDEAGTPLVGFVYLQTTADGHPARLDVPAWVQESGMLEEVSDAVRAECVVGNGYPYAVETADEAAVMTARDREQFLRVMQDFAAEHRLDFGLSRKPASKARRR